MSEQELGNVISLGDYVSKRLRTGGEPRVWHLKGNPAEALRGRFITEEDSPQILKFLYTPRTSKSPGRRNVLPPSDDDGEPIA